MSDISDFTESEEEIVKKESIFQKIKRTSTVGRLSPFDADTSREGDEGMRKGALRSSNRSRASADNSAPGLQSTASSSSVHSNGSPNFIKSLNISAGSMSMKRQSNSHDTPRIDESINIKNSVKDSQYLSLRKGASPYIYVSTPSASASVASTSLSLNRNSNKHETQVTDSALAVLSPPDFYVTKIIHDGKCFTSRYGHSVVEYNNKIYLYGGVDDKDKPTSNMIVFSPLNNTFSLTIPTIPSPGPRLEATLAVYSGSEYFDTCLCLFGGEDDLLVESDETWLYSVSNACWKKLPKSTINPTPRKGHCCVTAKESTVLYIWGGYSASSDTLYDGYYLSGSKWKKMKGLNEGFGPSGRCFHSGVLCINKANKEEVIYIFGGDFTGNGSATNQLWSYVTNTDVWIEIVNARGEPPLPRWKHGATVFDNRMWISGGLCNGWFANYALSDLYAYDIIANCWFQCDIDTKELGHHADFGGLSFLSTNRTLFIFGGLDYYGHGTLDVCRLAPVCTTVSIMKMRGEMGEVRNELTTLIQKVDDLKGTVNKLESVACNDVYANKIKALECQWETSKDVTRKQHEAMVALETSIKNAMTVTADRFSKVFTKLEKVEQNISKLDSLSSLVTTLSYTVKELTTKIDDSHTENNAIKESTSTMLAKEDSN